MEAGTDTLDKSSAACSRSVVGVADPLFVDDVNGELIPEAMNRQQESQKNKSIT